MAEFRIPIRILYGDGTLEHISGLGATECCWYMTARPRAG